jgi:phytoene/squalene synthetase
LRLPVGTVAPMRALPFFMLRPILLAKGTLLDRRDPDLARLRSIDDPDRFGWAVLPHVARSFGASIVMLPEASARAACVGYLYARMLDTLEDLVPDPAQRVAGLRWFADRFSTGEMGTDAPEMEIVATSPQEDVHRLLVERWGLVDRLYARLPDGDREKVSELVTRMAASMEHWSATFERQGGVLETEEQLARYCDDVIGEPARFALGMMVRTPVSESHRRRIVKVSELVQLANVTRDVERDLQHGVAYHPALKPFLGCSAADAHVQGQIRAVREELLIRALRCVPAYALLLAELRLPRVSAVRGSAVLMLLFTDRYYRACAVRVGREPWRGTRSKVGLLGSAVLSALSRRWAVRVAQRIEARFLAAADTIEGAPA